MKRSTTIVATGALALVATTINPTAAQSAPQPRCLTAKVVATMELDRSGALMRTRFSDGCTTLGEAITSGRARVQFGTTVHGGRAIGTVTITDPNEPTSAAGEAAARAEIPFTDAQIDQVIADFLAHRLTFHAARTVTATVALGSTLDPDTAFSRFRPHPLRPARLLAPGDIYDYGCISDTKEFTKYGCYRRHGGYSSTASARYLLDDNQSTGHGTRVWVATKLGMRNGYGNATTVIKWQPGADIAVGACRTITATIGFQGTGVSVSAPVCPSKLHPSVSQHSFSSVWLGRSNGATEGADGMNLVAISPKSSPSGFHSSLDWDDCWMGLAC